MMKPLLGFAATLAAIVAGAAMASPVATHRDHWVHMFVFRWKAAATADQKSRAVAEIRAFSDKIPGLLQLHVGTNVGANGHGFETGGFMKFEDRAAYDAYTRHPLHRRLLTWLVPLVEPIEVDFVDRE